jgi:hypothetical protein
MHDGNHNEVILVLDWIDGSRNKGTIDVVKKTMAIENGAQVDVPLREVMGIKAENDQRKRMHHNGEGSDTTNNGHSRVGGHG